MMRAERVAEGSGLYEEWFTSNGVIPGARSHILSVLAKPGGAAIRLNGSRSGSAVASADGPPASGREVQRPHALVVSLASAFARGGGIASRASSVTQTNSRERAKVLF